MIEMLAPNTVPQNADIFDVYAKPGKFQAYKMRCDFTIRGRGNENHSHSAGDIIIVTDSGTAVIPAKAFEELFTTEQSTVNSQQSTVQPSASAEATADKAEEPTKENTEA
jgi:hypothetical protein